MLSYLFEELNSDLLRVDFVTQKTLLGFFGRPIRRLTFDVIAHELTPCDPCDHQRGNCDKFSHKNANGLRHGDLWTMGKQLSDSPSNRAYLEIRR